MKLTIRRKRPMPNTAKGGKNRKRRRRKNQRSNWTIMLSNQRQSKKNNFIFLGVDFAFLFYLLFTLNKHNRASPGSSPTVKIIQLDQVMVEEQRQMQRHSKAQQKLTTSRAKHKTFPMEIPNKGHRSRGDTPAWGSSVGGRTYWKIQYTTFQQI